MKAIDDLRLILSRDAFDYVDEHSDDTPVASMYELANVIERSYNSMLNTLECLVEANAALREQLNELKTARREREDVPRP